MNGNDIKQDDHDAMHSCFICQAPATKKCPFCEADVYYCCQSHFELHRSKSNNGEAQCNPFSIKFTESVGRYMVANRDIEAGETIFQDTAAVVGPAVDTLPLCLNCHAKVRENIFSKMSWILNVHIFYFRSWRMTTFVVQYVNFRCVMNTVSAALNIKKSVNIWEIKAQW